ncbi:reverse transcriptase domain-containing protein [Cytobacillus firmus]|uniref:reverse transcriptase domain-containing protein n=1 Tax=Cytobacillus firmus TaxID=1399 RepID=UPI0036CF2D33
MGTKRPVTYYDFGNTQNELFRKSCDGKKFENLYEIIISEENILLAYRLVKSNSGARTSGADKKTIEDIAKMDKEHFVNHIRANLENYKPKAVKRVWIPKADGNSKRPLGIPSIIDRIIQQMFLNVLEPICEARFHKHSYGFRPNRSTHHAVARVQHLINRGKQYYTVDIDIKGFFDNVNHSLLLKQMWQIGIKDKRVIAIVSKMLKAPIKGEGIPTKGVPQGGILSPLLANIVLNELDWWISDQWETFQTRHSYTQRHHYYALKTSSNLKPGYLIRYADDCVPRKQPKCA